MSKQLGIIIVEKLGALKLLNVKDYKEEELYKKCGFKKAVGFDKQVEWGVKLDKKKYIASVYAKMEGKHNTENKYDFPPPIDTILFFGNCVVVLFEKMDDGKLEPTSLSIELWDRIYEKLFGGFEDLSSTAIEDEMEEDELANISAKYKTKTGYLKDGFVVDSESDKVNDGSDNDDTEDSFDDNESTEMDAEYDLHLENIGAELSEDEYVEDD